MGNVLHRTTKEYRTSVNTPEYDPSEWVINPDLSRVEGVPSYYWKIEGDSVVEMTPEEKKQVDAQRLPALKAARLGELKAAVTEYIGAHYAEATQKTLLMLFSDAQKNGMTNRANYIQLSVDWVKGVLDYYISKAGEIQAGTTVESVKSVVYDLSQFDASDPGVTVYRALSIHS